MEFDLERAAGDVAYRLLIGLVAPRPIALITSMDEQGRLNAAPFSAYNYFSTDPPIVGVGVTNRPEAKQVPKDTARNIRRTGEFVVNVVTEDIAQKMNICATDFPAGMSEVELAGFTDPIGSRNYNIALSQRRAETVQRYLVMHNVPLRSIYIVGLGENTPPPAFATNASSTNTRLSKAELHRLSRRVSVQLYGAGDLAQGTASRSQ